MTRSTLLTQLLSSLFPYQLLRHRLYVPGEGANQVQAGGPAAYAGGQGEVMIVVFLDRGSNSTLITHRSRPSFPPHTHIHCTQEILRIAGNLDQYFTKVAGFYKLQLQLN